MSNRFSLWNTGTRTVPHCRKGLTVLEQKINFEAITAASAVGTKIIFWPGNGQANQHWALR